MNYSNIRSEECIFEKSNNLKPIKDYPNNHRAGYVNIIGKPNVGKSTLMNAFMGEKFSIITSKAQTTRHRILGIINGEDFQLVLSDTPGIITPKYGLQKSMMKFVNLAIEDADVILYIREVGMSNEIHEETLRALTESEAPVYLVLNKIDASTEDEVKEKVKEWKEKSYIDKVFAVSALQNLGTKQLLEQIIQQLPESPPYFPKDQLTDKPERFFVEEILREKILKNYKQEIPYSVELVTESFKEEEDIIHIRVNIITERQSQKPILIGKGGSMLKKVGTEARKDLESFFGKQVHLETYVKVKENWRDDERSLRRFGYE